MSDVAVLVSSYDGVADTWPIIAELFQRFWPDRQWPMYWMTNGETVPSVATPIMQPRVERHCWGHNLAGAVESIPEEFVLWWIEDALLLSAVPNEILLEGAELLRTHADVGYVSLVRYYAAPKVPTVGQYFTNYPEDVFGCYAPLPAIHRKPILAQILRAFPVPRDYEVEGSSVMMKQAFPAMRSLIPAVPTFRYCDNAVLAGPWRQCAVQHLRQLGYDPDFSRRGISPDVCSWMDGKGP
jgi:hypothetical protein